MNTALLIFILLLHGALLYSLHYQAAKRFDRELHQIRRNLSRRIRLLNRKAKILEDKLENSTVSGDKDKDRDKGNRTPKNQNPLIGMEDRHVAEIKDNEVVEVNGKLVRKSEAFKIK